MNHIKIALFYVNKRNELYVELKDDLIDLLRLQIIYEPVKFRLNSASIYGTISRIGKAGVYLKDWSIENELSK